jgi:secondary thiamine-phosphate synthase enzyme
MPRGRPPYIPKPQDRKLVEVLASNGVAETTIASLLDRLVPEKAGYRHEDEGPDDMPAHIKAALTQTQLSVPVDGGHLVLGTWQGIYLFEHRAAPHRREIVLYLIGE